jgi:8-oxo-dGTP pyrophosphatase MutT (NUDIX family)
MEMINTASPSGYHSFPESINASTVNIPLHRLRELFLDIQRFSAMAIIFASHPDSPTKLRVLLIKRNGKNSSWGNTWEPAGGGPDDKDRTILDSAARESEEETQIRPSRFAGMALTCAFYHTDRKTGSLVVMRTVGFIINHNEETMAGRVWSQEMKQPLGQSSVKISEEHLDHCWFTEEEVRKAVLYKEAGSQESFTMLLAKKDMVLLAFELFRRNQHQEWPPSIKIIR